MGNVLRWCRRVATAYTVNGHTVTAVVGPRVGVVAQIRARRCVSRDDPHLAEHPVKHPVKHCETHHQSVTKRRQPPLPGAPTDPLPTARPHARYPVRPPGYCRGHEPLSRPARRVRLDGLRPHRPMRCHRFREESAAPWALLPTLIAPNDALRLALTIWALMRCCSSAAAGRTAARPARRPSSWWARAALGRRTPCGSQRA